MRDLLECVWPAAPSTAATLHGPASSGLGRFEQQVRREITRRGGQRPCLRIVRKLFAALATRPAWSRTDAAHWSGCSCSWKLADTQRKLPGTETRMVAVLDELELTETGDPHRFATARALIKHAGLAPPEKPVRDFHGRTKLTGKGRPKLRLAA